jgi:hypothetical protein
MREIKRNRGEGISSERVINRWHAGNAKTKWYILFEKVRRV